ncbi:unnamed protein product [Coregonus sp. 'balchen']|nr:unnamed protein product [Coregonus sp. 'balchen']
MQPNYSELVAHQAGNGFSLTIQPELLTRTPAGATGGSAIPETSDEFRVPILSSGPGEPSGGGGGGASSRRSRATSRTSSHSHSHGGGHQHSHSEPSETDPADADLESGEPSTSFSELRYLFRWVQKSLPFIIILSAKLVIQHALGSSVNLIFLSPAVEPLGFWEVLWAVGVTNFMLKFFFMGFKCLILLLPSNLVTFRAQLFDEARVQR